MPTVEMEDFALFFVMFIIGLVFVVAYNMDETDVRRHKAYMEERNAKPSK